MTALAGTAAAVHYARAGLALAHFDARAHLVVARRILDSLMPGWQQIGAVWLPLPHVLNMLPVQVDAWYRSGASAIAISIASMALGAAALARFIIRRTDSWAAAAAGAALLMANPNVLYLQSTPMTEPLLFGTSLLAVALVADWVDNGAASARAAGLALTAACLTRYEAWPICAATLVLAFVVLLRRGTRLPDAIAALLRVSIYPAIALVLFVLNSRWTTGSWFVSSGFFVAENDALGQPLVAWDQVIQGVHKVSGAVTVYPAYAAAIAIAIVALRAKARTSLILVLGLAAAAALPWYAYVQGHPFRIRYSVPLVVACAAIVATAIALLPRLVRPLAAAAVVAATVWQVPPLDRAAPLIVESQRDVQNSAGRAVVTAYLVAHRDGFPIMMSMGSLAHYMHDLSRDGFAIHDFLHEGNGEVWKAAMRYGPRAYVRWVAIEESAEGGDAVYLRTKEQRGFLDGFERVAEGGGVALYRATPHP
ncbi:MAG TPA: hypothetical protein VFJ02_21110 [Vicinamibacterales bacterium]|nr:hypothetical protein [Vicinamibacterales bacterium]